MITQGRVSGKAIAICQLVSLAAWLVAGCGGSAPATTTPAPEPHTLLYTRTPIPTVTPFIPTPTLSPQTLYDQGLTRRELWDLQTALARFDAALALAPDRPPLYVSRAELHRLLGRYEEAAADLETALALEPELAAAWQQKVLLHYATEAWDEALAAANALVELRPEDGTAYALRARIYAQGLGNLRQALADFNRAGALDPALDKETLVERWHILAALRRWDQALRASHEMYITGSQDPLRYYYRGWSLIRLGRLDEAIRALFYGIGRYPDEPVALYYALGVAYYERGAWEEAIRSLEVALAQTGASSGENAGWRSLDIDIADILGPMGLAYLEQRQCETGAAIAQRAVAESVNPGSWSQDLEQRIQECYLSLTPTPTPGEGG